METPWTAYQTIIDEHGVDPRRVPRERLRSGAEMPAIGLGTFGSDHYSGRGGRGIGTGVSMSKVTIHDVAERASVSIGTVSAVVNRKNTVSKSTRRKVLQAISELNYRPRAAAWRWMQPAPAKSIGLVIQETCNPYYDDLIIGVQQAATLQGYHTLVVSSEGTYKLERQLVDLLIAKDVEGLIIDPLLNDEVDLSHLFEIKQHNIPFVLLEHLRGIQASMVNVENVAALEIVVEYLISRGHKRIIHFAGPKDSIHTHEHIKGVCRAFSGQRLALDDSDIVHAGTRLEDGYRTGLDYFRDRTEDRPTAVTCYNDLLALGLIRALRELGLGVPDDVSIIGYGDIDVASYASIPLTTVQVPTKEMGHLAAELLLKHIETCDVGTIEKVCLQAELIERASVRAL